MHLVDHARAYIEIQYKRPLKDRLFRAMLAASKALSPGDPSGKTCSPSGAAV